MATHNLGRVAYADKGAYNSSTTYINKDVVQYNNGSYVLQADTATGIVPTNTSYWTPMQNPTALNQATASANTAAQSANTAANSAVKAAETANTVMNNTASPIRKSATGKFIELDNAANKPLAGLKLYGRTEQVKTTGKNLANCSDMENVSNTGYFPIIPLNISELVQGKTYTLSAEIKSSVVPFHATVGRGANTHEIDVATVYDQQNGLVKITFTVPENYAESSGKKWFLCAPRYYQSTTMTYSVKNVQVEEGSTATAYEPYTGGIPSPNPNYPQPLVSPGDNGSIGVKTMGKNLLPINSINTNQNDAGLVELTYLPAGTYTLSADITKYADDTATNTRMSCSIIYTDGQTEGFSTDFDVNKAENDGITRRKQRSFLIRADKKVQRIVIYALDYSVLGSGRNAKAENIQIEYGPTATAYEPYKNGGSLTASTPNGLPGIPVTSGGNYVDANGQRWVCDYKDYERGVYVKMVERVVCDSSNAVFAQSGLWYVNGIIANTTHGRLSVLASHYKAYGTNELQHGNVCVNGLGMVVFGNENYTDEATMRADIAQNPVTIAFVLPVPDETPIPADELAAFRAMSTFDPYTVVYNDANAEMIADYIGETEKFVHEVIDDRTAPPIIETVSGSITSVNDSSNRPLAGLRLYGKTTQDGTPTPDAPVPLVNVGAGGSIGVKSQGKNLLDVSCVPQTQTLHGVTLVNNGDGSLTFSGTAVNNSAWAFKLNTPIPAGTYTLSANNAKAAQNAALNLYFADSSGIDSASAQLESVINSSKVLAVKNPITHLKVYFTAGMVADCVTIRPQLEIGTVTTAYEPYKDGGNVVLSTPNGLPGIPVSSGGNYVDSTGQMWLCDEIDLARGVYIQRVGRILIDSTNTSLSLQNSGGLCQAFVSPSPYVPGYAIDPSPYMMCDTLPPVPRINAAEQAINGASLTGDHILLRVAGVTTIAGMREWLAANPTTVLYKPAQPIAIETPLSASELAAYRAMSSQYPNTTVYNDAGAGMAIDYIADTKAYIDKKLAAIAAALIEQ